MDRILIENGYRLTMPKTIRRGLKVGEEMLVTRDRSGRIVFVSEKQIRATLERTAGIWQGRKDIPENGAKYVRLLRRGRRLKQIGAAKHASH